MKPFPLARLCLTALLSAWLGRTAALADPGKAAIDLHYTIPVELGDAHFAPGDSITIGQVQGASDQLKPGGTYCVSGTYTLASHAEANLALFTTVAADSPAGSTQVEQRQTIHVTQGTGAFRLITTLNAEGYLHVSFYPVPSGNDFGGIYFGQGKWVLHHRDFSGLAESSAAHPPAAVPQTPALSAANLAMLAYLGNAVAAPAGLPASYTPDGLRQAIQTAAQQAGATLRKIEIEDSEFPALVGVICEHDDYVKLMSQIKTMSEYADQGGVGGQLYHAMGIIPYQAFPADSSEIIEHRLMLREQMLYDKLSQEQ